MAGEISYTTADLSEQWHDDQLYITRIHLGITDNFQQPIFNEDRSICIFMYGEVFDYLPEKRQLINNGHIFRMADSCAEYVLHLYESYGTKAFTKLNGSYIIVIYHTNTGEFVLVVDRFLSRPVFYHFDGQQLFFGSQLRPILRFPGLPRGLDMQAVLEFFCFRSVLGERTFLASVKTMPPAGILRIHDGELLIDRYWQPKYGDQLHRDAYYVEALAHSFIKAVSRMTQSNNRYGLFLSGGLDSRTILAADVEHKIEVAFTQGDFKNREYAVAQRSAAKRKIRHVFLKRDFDHYYRMVDDAVDLGDGMYHYIKNHNLGFMENLRSEAEIVLDGLNFGPQLKASLIPQGSVIFCGQTIPLPIMDIDKQATIADGVSKIMQYSQMSSITRSLFTISVAQIKDMMTASVESFLKSIPEAESLPMEDRISYLFHSYSARQNMDYIWVLHNRHFVESRTVMFDNDMLDLSFAIPTRQKLNGRLIKKVISRLSLSQALIPYANTGLPAVVTDWPECILLMGSALLKKYVAKPGSLPMSYYTDGSWPNFAELFRNNSNIANLLSETISNPRCLNPDIFDQTGARLLLEQHMSGQIDFSDTLTSLLTFGRWYNKYGPEDGNSINI